MFHRVRALVAVGCLCVLMGCGEDVPPEEVPPLHPVSGKITMDGEPAAGVAVTFMPSEKSTGTGAYGATDGSGTYTLEHRSGQPGIPAGDYDVMFSKMVQPDGSPIPEGQTAADVMAINAIPERYRRTPKRATVKEGGGTFDFELESK